jgi:hypothetical protein
MKIAGSVHCKSAFFESSAWEKWKGRNGQDKNCEKSPTRKEWVFASRHFPCLASTNTCLPDHERVDALEV